MSGENGKSKKSGQHKKIDKRRKYVWATKYINAENIRICILFIPLTVLLVKEIMNGSFAPEDFTDTSILISFFVVFLCESIARIIFEHVQKSTEDAVKLSEDYEALVKKYCGERERMVSVGQDLILPAIELASRKLSEAPFKICIMPNKDTEGNIRRYPLPKQVADNSRILFRAHDHSEVFNNINIRLRDLKAEGTEIRLTYEFTTYFDSLLTNRAMDFPFQGNRTVREIYEPGPILNPLNVSKLSNHLGFNGFVRLKDGKIIFVYRNKKVSIGKGTWSNSVGASLKTKYCLNAEHELTVEGLSDAIAMEIRDELKIEKDPTYDYTDSIIAFYRDLVEGGKPQFLFFYEEKRMDSTAFEKHFYETLKKEKEEYKEKHGKEMLTDGEKFAFFTIEELKQCKININSIEYEPEKSMEMMPSAAASVALLLKVWYD